MKCCNAQTRTPAYPRVPIVALRHTDKEPVLKSPINWSPLMGLSLWRRSRFIPMGHPPGKLLRPCGQWPLEPFSAVVAFCSTQSVPHLKAFADG